MSAAGVNARRFVIACGGTGGHLSPGIALAEALLARGHGVTLFISQKKVDARLVAHYAQLAVERVPSAPFSWGPRGLLRFYAEQLKGLLFSLRFICAYQPDVIIGFGGFTSAAVVLAGWLRGIPVALHEANRIPGRAIRLLAWGAQRLYLPPGVALPGRRGRGVRPTGLPVRADIMRQAPAVARAQLGVDPTQKLLVLLGGSQGSSNLNQWAEDNWAALASAGIQLYCVTGLGKGQTGERSHVNHDGVVVRAWFEAFSDRVGVLLSAADLVVSRAGAGTLAELVRCVTPAILLPYPQAADNHQWANATYFVQQGGGLVLAESALPTLRAEVLRVLQADALLAQFRAQLLREAQEDSLATMVPDLELLARGSPAGRRRESEEVVA